MKLLIIAFFTLFFCSNILAQEPDDEGYDDTTISSNPQEEPQKKLNLENVFIGSTFSLDINSSFLFIDISPFGGYHLTPNLGVGAGFTYIYETPIQPNSGLTDNNIFGARLFINWRPFPESSVMPSITGVYVHLEGEYLNRSIGPTIRGFSQREWVPAVNVGLGYNYNFNEGFSFIAEFLVNALWFHQTQNNTITPVFRFPFQYRIGVSYAF
jgi:hypothetical protein